VHDPAGLAAPGGPTSVEDERLLHADEDLPPEDLPVLAGRLPVAGLCGPVRPQSRRVLAVLDAEEVPFLFPPCGPSCTDMCTCDTDRSVHTKFDHEQQKNN
jgi:hypothetical protein